ncbi:MAG: DUF1538 domain-containing protein, partial [Candidatus Electrothrix sp. AUS3]|nr:DUF1538 domain-containing protein [Candidatus Electrothrix gigas]
SLFPIITVLGYAQFGQWMATRQRKKASKENKDAV